MNILEKTKIINALELEREDLLNEKHQLERDIIDIDDEIAEIDRELERLDGNDIICEPEE